MRDNFLVFGSPAIEEPETAEVVATLRSGWIGTGPRVARFEEMFRDCIGADHAIALNSCTTALFLEVILHDRTGLLSPEGDAEALACNLERLVPQPQVWEPMGTAVRHQVAENSNVRTQGTRLKALYTNLPTPGPRSGE